MWFCTFNARNDCPLLNGRGFFKTICINSPEESFLQVHVIKVVRNLGPVALKLNKKGVKWFMS